MKEVLKEIFADSKVLWVSLSIAAVLLTILVLGQIFQ